MMNGYKTFAGLAAAAIIQIASASGVDLGVEEQPLAEALGTLAALAWAAWGRYTATRIYRD